MYPVPPSSPGIRTRPKLPRLDRPHLDRLPERATPAPGLTVGGRLTLTPMPGRVQSVKRWAGVLASPCGKGVVWL